jgi:hypothetical protein
MVETIDRTIARLKGDRAMKDADFYSGVVSPEKQAEYLSSVAASLRSGSSREG